MNKISEVIGNMEKPNFPFKPTADFYEQIGIKRKRFWALYRKEVSPRIEEVQALSKYLGVKANELVKF